MHLTRIHRRPPFGDNLTAEAMEHAAMAGHLSYQVAVNFEGDVTEPRDLANLATALMAASAWLDAFNAQTDEPPTVSGP